MESRATQQRGWRRAGTPTTHEHIVEGRAAVAGLSLLRHLSPICCTFVGEPQPRSTVRRPQSAAQLPRRGGRPARARGGTGSTMCLGFMV
jgi:hypothetical protein